jgi:hypothetical protein
MWKIFWTCYLFLYFYTVFSQDFFSPNNTELAVLGGFLAFCICIYYLHDFKSWINQLNEDKESLSALQTKVSSIQDQIIEMQLHLGWIKPHPDEPDTYIQNDKNEIEKEYSVPKK